MPSLTTRCPQCGTAFKVVADQLRVRQGLVRCGVCSAVFDGYARLIGEAETAAPTVPPIAPALPPVTPAPVAPSPAASSSALSPASAQPPWSMPRAYPAAPAEPVAPQERSASQSTSASQSASAFESAGRPLSARDDVPAVLRDRSHASRRARENDRMGDNAAGDDYGDEDVREAARDVDDQAAGLRSADFQRESAHASDYRDANYDYADRAAASSQDAIGAGAIKPARNGDVRSEDYRSDDYASKDYLVEPLDIDREIDHAGDADLDDDTERDAPPAYVAVPSISPWDNRREPAWTPVASLPRDDRHAGHDRFDTAGLSAVAGRGAERLPPGPTRHEPSSHSPSRPEALPQGPTREAALPPGSTPRAPVSRDPGRHEHEPAVFAAPRVAAGGTRAADQWGRSGTTPREAEFYVDDDATPADEGARHDERYAPQARDVHPTRVTRDADPLDDGFARDERDERDEGDDYIDDNDQDTAPVVRGETRMRHAGDPHAGVTPPEFLDDEIEQHNTFGRWFWGIACILAVVALALTSIWTYRNAIVTSAPQLRPVLATLCARMGCEVGYARRIDRIAILSSSLQPPAGGFAAEPGRNRLILRLVIRNRYSLPQPLPALTLELTDFSDTIVARKVLRPEMYLPANLASQPFAAEGELSVAVPIDVTDLQVNGYQVGKFFP